MCGSGQRPVAIDDDGLAGEIGITNGVEVTPRGIVRYAGPRGKEIGGRFCLQLGLSFLARQILPAKSGEPCSGAKVPSAFTAWFI
jgi:hypothetical protein